MASVSGRACLFLVQVGPRAILATGDANHLSKALLGIRRSLGTLVGTRLAPLSQSSGGAAATSDRRLLLTGSAPCLWLEAAEPGMISGCLPRDLPLARCCASVNMNLFKLWHACSAIVPGGGTGSADVSRLLLSLLR